MKDVAAERAVLAGIFSFGSDGYIDVSDIIKTETFTDDSNQIIYQCIKNLFEKNPNVHLDLPSFLSSANELGFYEHFSNSEEDKYLRGVMSFPIKQQNVREFAKKIRKLQVARDLELRLEECREDLHNITGQESLDQILGKVESPIIEFGQTLGESDNSPKQIGNDVEEYIQYLEENPCDIVGISSGYPNYDRAIGGAFRRGTVNLVGARLKTGKSFFGDNVCLHVSGKLGLPSLNLDTEMSKRDHLNRMLANLSGVTIDEIETGKFKHDPRKREKIHKAAEYLKSIPLDYISIAGQPFEETISTMRRWVAKRVGKDENGKTKDCLIVLDYLKLMSSDSLDDNVAEWQQLGFMTTALHNFSVKYDLPILTFIQLNRDGITKETTDVASGSDRILWLCSNFSIFKTKSEEELAHNKDSGNRKLIPIACRHGGGLADGDYINMNLNGAVGRLEERGTRNQNYDLGEDVKDGDVQF